MPGFHPEGVRTYLTSYSLPTASEFDEINYWDRNPRQAPPFALHEEIRKDQHEFLEDGIMLPCYDSNRVPVKYSTVTAEPGAPLQVHFMIWSQQVIHDVEMPRGEDEFLDIRVELTVDNHLVDVAYINHGDIKPNGLPFGIEFVGERTGDARDAPLFFTSTPAAGGELAESRINILVALGRIGEYFYWDKSKVMSKMVRVGPVVMEGYESSTYSRNFRGYTWRKTHKQLIRNRAINPNTKLFEWRREWTRNDLYRLNQMDQAYARAAQEWADLEAEAEATNVDDNVIKREEAPPADHETQPPKPKKVKTTENSPSSSITVVPSNAASPVSAPSFPETPESFVPYSFRRPRRSSSTTVSISIGPSSRIHSTKNSPSQSSTKKEPDNRSPADRKLPNHPSPRRQETTTPPVQSTPTSIPRKNQSKAQYTLTVQKDDPQVESRMNVTFGKVPFKTSRHYFRDFIPYQDLCRVEYLVGKFVTLRREKTALADTLK
ncbi:hypothetical protein ABW19_dt0201773 [Dactylella cylindrospora]|nr:hypothetical protein ABW19_dt0201773 [Dactylella cylindrospora]